MASGFTSKVVQTPNPGSPGTQPVPLQNSLQDQAQQQLNAAQPYAQYGAGYHLLPSQNFGEVNVPGPNQTIFGNPQGPPAGGNPGQPLQAPQSMQGGEGMQGLIQSLQSILGGSSQGQPQPGGSSQALQAPGVPQAPQNIQGVEGISGLIQSLLGLHALGMYNQLSGPSQAGVPPTQQQQSQINTPPPAYQGAAGLIPPQQQATVGQPFGTSRV